MGRSPDERVTNALAREVCEREGFKAMLSGSIGMLGSRFVIALNAVNCATGDTLAREQVEAEDKEHILNALGKATSSLRARLGESLSSIQKMDMPLEDATTSSLEAFKAFALAEAQKTTGNSTAALALYEHAVELDPNFALAYGRQGVLYSNYGEPERAREKFRKAFALINRVSERERLYITSNYYANGTHESEKAIETLELYKRTYPKDPTPANNLAVEYMRAGQFEKALQGYQEVLRLDPKMPIGYGNVADAYIHLGRFEEAKQISERGAALGFETTHGPLFAVAFAQHDAAGMARQLEWSRGRPEEVFMMQGQVYAAQQAGQWRKAGEIVAQAMELARQRKQDGPAGSMLAGFALDRAEVGFCQQVQDRTRQAVALNRDAAAPAGAALALCGETARAEALAADLEKSFPTDTMNIAVHVPAIRAVIALKQHQPARALELLQTGSPYDRAYGGVVYLRGLAHMEAKSGAEAMVDFQTLLDHRGAYLGWYPLAQVGLARAAALAGDRAKSKQAYQDFLALWKDADADVPLLQAVKKEYARLQ